MPSLTSRTQVEMLGKFRFISTAHFSKLFLEQLSYKVNICQVGNTPVAFVFYPPPTRLNICDRYPYILERLKPACELAHDKVKIYGRVFAHLMFDRVYFEAVKESGVEDFDDSFPLPLIPAGLRRNARAQWIADFAALVAYAEDHSETAYRRSDPFKHGNETTKTNVRKASPVFVGRRSKATDANKRLADENARMAAKLERMKTTLKVLMSKVAAKTQQSADGSDKDFVEHLRSTISALLQRLSNTHDNPGKIFQPTLQLFVCRSWRIEAAAKPQLRTKRVFWKPRSSEL